MILNASRRSDRSPEPGINLDITERAFHDGCPIDYLGHTRATRGGSCRFVSRHVGPSAGAESPLRKRDHEATKRMEDDGIEPATSALQRRAPRDA